MLVGKKYLQCFSAHGSNTESQPGTQEHLRTMDLATGWLSDLQHPSVTRPSQGSGPLGNCVLMWGTHGPKPKSLLGTSFHSAAMRLAPILHEGASSVLCPSLLCCSPHNLPAGQGGRGSRQIQEELEQQDVSGTTLPTHQSSAIFLHARRRFLDQA